MKYKYIDAEKLKAEIERLKKRAEHYEEISLTDGERSYWSGENGALELLATFITSLLREQPEVGLENADTEYICKDALMEWAKSKKARLKQGYKHDWKNDDMIHGGTLILDSLIDKIESL